MNNKLNLFTENKYNYNIKYNHIISYIIGSIDKIDIDNIQLINILLKIELNDLCLQILTIK